MISNNITAYFSKVKCNRSIFLSYNFTSSFISIFPVQPFFFFYKYDWPDRPQKAEGGGSTNCWNKAKQDTEGKDSKREEGSTFQGKVFKFICVGLIIKKNTNLLLTAQERCTGEYWPEVVPKMPEGHYYSPVRLKQARLVSSLLYGTQVLCLFWNCRLSKTKSTHLMTVSIETVQSVWQNTTKKEPIRTLGFTPRLHVPFHIRTDIMINI